MLSICLFLIGCTTLVYRENPSVELSIPEVKSVKIRVLNSKGYESNKEFKEMLTNDISRAIGSKNISY